MSPGPSAAQADLARRATPGSLAATLCSEIVRDGHRYVSGLGQREPTIAADSRTPWRRFSWQVRERCRDLVERSAARAGFSRRHFDPTSATEVLVRILALSDGFENTYARLADEPSRRALVDLLKLRVLGPYHAPLAITPEMFRARQAYVDRNLREQRSTFHVSDPWFSPISLYRVPRGDGSSLSLHSHSVDVVSVFLLDQYGYARASQRVAVNPGDVVLDVGGCWGDTALYFANLVGPAGKVYTFEFDPESLTILNANLALNPALADRIEVVERALWDRSGETVEFVQAGRMTTIVPAESASTSHSAETVTLDDFVEQAGLDRLGFLKLDVEGAEHRVLRGARGSLERFVPELAVAAYHREDDLVTIPEALVSLDLGYRFYLQTSSPVEEETVLFAVAGA